jgi:hypothetical protein
MKKVSLVQNSAGGVDLMTERDAGNAIRILTGKPEYSRAFWKKIQMASKDALAILEK